MAPKNAPDKVELVSKSGKSRELSSAINEKIVPILKKQAGFVDEIVLVSDAESNRILALSFWKTREDAERYQREQYNSVRETLRSLLEAEPVVRTSARFGKGTTFTFLTLVVIFALAGAER